MKGAENPERKILQRIRCQVASATTVFRSRLMVHVKIACNLICASVLKLTLCLNPRLVLCSASLRRLHSKLPLNAQADGGFNFALRPLPCGGFVRNNCVSQMWGNGV